MLTIIAAASLLAACTEKPASEPSDVRPVRTVVVGRSNGTIGANYSGEIRARYESQLGFRTAGKIVARMVEVGSHVKRGQPLLQLDPTQEALQVAAAGADADAARSRVAQARVDVKRTEQLLAQNFASQAELDQQRLLLSQAEAQLRSAQARQQLNANMRGFTTLVADRDGVVSAINAEAGQVVAGSRSSPSRPTASARCRSAFPSRASTNCARPRGSRSRCGHIPKNRGTASCANWRRTLTASRVRTPRAFRSWTRMQMRIPVSFVLA